jgi:hypothetical protein
MLIKANFKLSKEVNYDESKNVNTEHQESNRDITQAEFEDYIIKSGASGSFMVFRSQKPEDELGLEEL